MTTDQVWTWVEPGEDDAPIVRALTETEILDTYYAWWAEQMLKVHHAPFITERNCIEDFAIVHWAAPL